MMKNNLKLKRCLGKICLVSIVGIILAILLSTVEYHSYTQNFNHKINAITEKIQEYYPKLTQNEIMEILNSSKIKENIFLKYNIDLKKDSLILLNQKNFAYYLLINSFFIVSLIIIITVIFLHYEKKQRDKLNEITNYLKAINKKNYTLNFKEESEDELSYLKQELYKVTVMLKEVAENSLADKENLKNSLEDISHQLKTPLTSISIILDNLMDNPKLKKKEQDSFFQDIKREVLNLNYLTQNLLKLAKFDASTITFYPKKVYVSKIISKVTQNLAPLSDLKNISFHISGNKKSQIKVDFKWQTEALTNIVKNSIEHSYPNHKVIINYEENNIYTLITITNEGKPIAKKDLNHIFERFYKGDNSSNDSIGIGLALAQVIIEKENGKIDVISDKKQTTFKIKYFHF